MIINVLGLYCPQQSQDQMRRAINFVVWRRISQFCFDRMQKQGDFFEIRDTILANKKYVWCQWCDSQLPKSNIFTRTSCTSVAKIPSINSDCVAVNPVPIMHPTRSAMSWAVLHFSHLPWNKFLKPVSGSCNNQQYEKVINFDTTSDCSFLTSSISTTNWMSECELRSANNILASAYKQSVNSN